MRLPSKTEMTLLLLLGPKETSAAKLMQSLAIHTSSAVVLGTFYTSMRRLGEAGWVKSRREGRSVSYAMTDEGRKKLKIAKAAHALKDELKGKV